jgi:hypothetical protein
MPQNQKFDFPLLSRIQAVSPHTDEQEADCNHAAVMI